MSSYCAIGMDIGATNTRIGAVTPDGTLLHSAIYSTKCISAGPPETAISDLANFIRQYINQYVTVPVRGIAAAFPATLDAKRQILYSASNLGENAKSRFDGMNVSEGLQKEFHLPVYIGKDSDFILYHDMHALNIQTSEIVAGIYFGTGIGSSFYYRGETVYGSDGVAGEIGHLPISDNRRLCTCGKRCGCCETVASGWRLIQLKEEFFPETPLPELFVRHAEHPALQTYVFDCARVIALTANLLNSAYTVIGGGIVNMPAFPKEQLRKDVESILRSPFPRNTFRMLFSPGGQSAGVLGAARFLFSKAKFTEAEEF